VARSGPTRSTQWSWRQRAAVLVSTPAVVMALLSALPAASAQAAPAPLPSAHVAGAVPARGAVGLPTPTSGTGRQSAATTAQLTRQSGPASGPTVGSASAPAAKTRTAASGLQPFVTPGVPTGLANDFLSTFTPRLDGTVSSSSGGTLTAHFYVQTNGCGSGCPNVVNDGTATAPSGSVARYTVPTGKVTAGASYQWWMKVCDSSGACSATTATQSFTIDPLLGAGDTKSFSYTTRKLTDRLTIKVNNGSGDLLLEQNDLTIPGLTSDLTLGRVFNSLDNATGASNLGGEGTGHGWQMSTGSDVKLSVNADNGVQVWLSDGSVAEFIPSGSAYLTPAGLDADLTKNADGSFTLAYHQSAEKLDFDSSGTLTGDTDRNGNKVTFAYRTCGMNKQVTTITGTRGDAGGRVVTVNYAPSGCARTGYTQTSSASAGSISRNIAIGQTNNTETSVTDAAGGGYSYGYTGTDLTSITTPDHHQVSIGYDGQHRATTLTQDPSGINAVTHFAYPSGTETDVTDPNGHVTKYFSDVYSRVTKTTDANGHDQNSTFNADNKVSSFQDASGTTNFAYANNGESLSQTTGDLGAQSSSTYNNTATKYLPDSSTDSMNNTKTFMFDGAGNQTSSSDSSSDQAYTHYNSSSSGRFQQFPGTTDFTTEPRNQGGGNPVPANCTRPSSDGGGVDNCTAYQYDSAGDLSAIVPPNGNSLRTQHFTSDGFGRLATATDGRGITTTYTYDNLDHITQLSYSDSTPTVSYTFNGDGTQATRSDSSGSTNFTYDALDRETGKSSTGATVYSTTYAYDGVGNLTSLTDGRGTTNYLYDPVNNLTKLTEGFGGHNVDVFKYNNDNQRTDTWDKASGYVLDSSNHVTTAPSGFAAHLVSSFDASNRLSGLKTSRSSSDTNLVENLSYNYTHGTQDTNNRQAVTDNLSTQTTTYAYNSASRLHSAVTSGSGPAYYYCYDKDGNLTVNATTNVSCTTANHTFNSANQLTDGSTNYDADGNLTSSPTSAPALTSLSYNGPSQTSSITPSGGSADNFGYAGPDQSERVSQSQASATNPTSVGYVNGQTGVQSQSVAVAGSPVATYYERDGNGTLLAEQTAGGSENYYYFDGTGSVIGLLDPTGKQVATFSYDPYGGHMSVGKGEATDTSVGDGNPWRYTGGQYDATTGLYRFGVRYYDPNLGRFTQLDPEQHLQDLRQGDRYSYAGGDPINNTDGSGESIGDFFAGAGLVLGVAGLVTLFPEVTLAAGVVASLSFAVGAAGAVYQYGCDINDCA
jgi:RHS repeat-associated protein